MTRPRIAIVIATALAFAGAPTRATAGPPTTSPFDPAPADAPTNPTEPTDDAATADPSEPTAAPEPAAPASPAGPRMTETAGWEDELVLKDGGFVRGRIAEMTPNARVVIQPTGAAPRTVAWSDIAEIRRATAPPPQAAVPVEVKVKMVPTVHLDIETTKPRPVTLFQFVDRSVGVTAYGWAEVTRYRRVCGSPCGRDVAIDADSTYFISGNGVTDSKEFEMPDRGRVKLKVRPGNRGVWLTGILFTVLGSVCLTSSIALGAASASKNTGAGARSNFRFVAGMLGGIGAPLFTAGIPMWVLGRTKVYMTSHR